MRYKLLVVDIDGTLVMRAGEISAADRAALAGVREHGIGVSLCTGRAMVTGRLIVENLGLDGYHMFFDGGLVADPRTGDIVYARPLSRDVVRRAVEFARRNQLAFDLFSAPAATWRTRKAGSPTSAAAISASRRRSLTSIVCRRARA